MDTEQLDAILARHRAAESRISANLVEFDQHRAFELLSADDLSGTTARQLKPLMNDAPLLWRWLTQLGEVLDRAAEVRAEGRLSRERIARLEHLLTGASVVLHTEDVPLSQRDLTSAASTESRVSIDQLIAMMRRTYEPLRDAIASIDQVWREVLPRLDAARRTLESLRSELETLAIGEPVELAAASMQFDEIERMVVEDPMALGAGAGAGLDTAVADAATRVHDLAAERAEFSDDLANMELQLAELRTTRALAAAAWSESTAKIDDPNGLVKTPGPQIIDGIGGLAERAAGLLDAADDWSSARHEHRRWADTVERLGAQLDRALHANRAPLETRDELRGRLAAYRAKATRLGVAAVTHPDIVDLADNAHNELFTAPVDLDRAATLVEHLGDALRRDNETAAP